MPQHRKPARIKKWKGKFHVFYYDHIEGRQRRLQCEELGAFNREERKELLEEYKTKEATEAGEVERRGGVLAYQTPLAAGIKAYKKHLEERVKARKTNPGSREGLSTKSSKELYATMTLFESWLKTKKPGLSTGRLDGPTLQAFFSYLAKRPTRCGNKTVHRSTSTLNKHRRNVRALLNFINEQRPPRFPDYDIFRKALKPLRVELEPPTVYTPKELTSFLETALHYESEAFTSPVVRLRQSGKTERFLQRPSHRASTPVSRLFLLLSLTGRRLQDLLGLRWQDVDLVNGHITFRSQKTGSIRILPMQSAPEGAVAPKLVKLMRIWKEQHPEAEFVLPHAGLKCPEFPKSAWQRVNRLAGIRRVGPQRLRMNFTSYAISIGIPADVAAFWQGHTGEVQRRHYLAQVLERHAGAVSMESAMGLDVPIGQLVG